MRSCWRFLSFGVLLGALFPWTGCGGGDPIAVVVLAPLTRFSTELGTHGRNGTQLAIEEINAAGGINGRPLELHVYDVGGGPDSCGLVLRTLLDSGYQYFIGPYTSNMAQPVMDAMQKRKALLLTPTMSADTLENRDDAILCMLPANQWQIKSMVSVIRQAGVDSLVALYDADNRAYSWTLVKNLSTLFLAQGGHSVVLDSIVQGVRPPELVGDYWASRSRPAFFISTSGSRSATVVQQLRKNGARPRLFGGSWGMTPDALEQGGMAIEGMVFSAPFPPAGVMPSANDFEQRYRLRFGKIPTFSATASWEAVQALAVGLRQANVDDPLAVRESLLVQPRFVGVYKDYRFNATGDVERPQTLVQVHNHAYVAYKAP